MNDGGVAMATPTSCIGGLVGSELFFSLLVFAYYEVNVLLEW